MLSAAHRMRDRDDFTVAVRRGRRAGRRSLMIYVATTGYDGPARVGLIVSKSVGSAVTRSHVKRRLRHALLARIDVLPLGTLLVVRAHPGISNRSFRELTEELDSALASVLRRKGDGQRLSVEPGMSP